MIKSTNQKQKISVTLAVIMTHILALYSVLIVKIPQVILPPARPLTVEFINVTDTLKDNKSLESTAQEAVKLDTDALSASQSSTNSTIMEPPEKTPVMTVKAAKPPSTNTDESETLPTRQSLNQPPKPKTKVVQTLSSQSVIKREKIITAANSDTSITDNQRFNLQSNSQSASAQNTLINKNSETANTNENTVESPKTEATGVQAISISKIVPATTANNETPSSESRTDSKKQLPSTSQASAHKNNESQTTNENTQSSVVAKDKSNKQAQGGSPNNKAIEESWKALVRIAIERKLQYPKQALSKKWGGQALVRMTIDSQGNVLSVSIVQSSHKDILDKEAIAVSNRASPLPKPPTDILNGATSRSFTIPIDFDYQRYQ